MTANALTHHKFPLLRGDLTYTQNDNVRHESRKGEITKEIFFLDISPKMC